MSPVLIIHFLLKVKHGNSLLPGTFKYSWLAYIYFKSLKIQNTIDKSSDGPCCLCAQKKNVLFQSTTSQASESFQWILYK